MGKEVELFSLIFLYYHFGNWINMNLLYLSCLSILYLVGTGRHRWDLPVLRYHEILVIYPYPFLVIITQLFS